MSDSNRYEEFVSLVRLYTSQVLAYINALLLNRNDAEDLFQETCLVLWQKFDEFQPGTNFLAWALRIADYKVMNFQTTQSRRVAFTAGLRDALMADVAKRECGGRGGQLSGSLRLHGTVDAERSKDGDTVLCRGRARSPSRRCAGPPPQSVYHSLRRIRSWLLDCIHRELKRDRNASFWSNPDILKEEDGP